MTVAGDEDVQLTFRTLAVKLCKELVQFLDLPLLLHLAEVISTYFTEIVQ